MKEKMSFCAWHFLSFSGEDITICETDCVYYYDALQNDTDLILNITYVEGDNVVHKVLVLAPDGNIREAAGENAYCQYASDEYLLIKQQYTKKSQYRELLVLSDTAAGTKTIIYPAVCGYDAKTGMGDGEQLGCVSLNDREVIFTFPTGQGIRYVIREGDKLFVRTLSVES